MGGIARFAASGPAGHLIQNPQISRASREAVPNAYIRRSLLTVSPRSTRNQTSIAPEARGAIEAFRDCGWSVTVVGGTRRLRAPGLQVDWRPTLQDRDPGGWLLTDDVTDDHWARPLGLRTALVGPHEGVTNQRPRAATWSSATCGPRRSRSSRAIPGRAGAGDRRQWGDRRQRIARATPRSNSSAIAPPPAGHATCGSGPPRPSSAKEPHRPRTSCSSASSRVTRKTSQVPVRGTGWGHARPSPRGGRIDRRRVYVTNAVKHFKWRPQGKRRLHERPNATEVAPVCRGCRPSWRWSVRGS